MTAALQISGAEISTMGTIQTGEPAGQVKTISDISNRLFESSPNQSKSSSNEVTSSDLNAEKNASLVEDKALDSAAYPKTAYQEREAINRIYNETGQHSKTKPLSDSEMKEMFGRVIERVKQDFELTGVLRSHGINLKRGAGGYMVANCPFPNHADSSPSFKVKSGSEQYCCYGCSAKGDVLDFIRDFHRLGGVKDAIQYLTGKTVPELYKAIKNGGKLPVAQAKVPTIAKQIAPPEPEKSSEEIEANLENATNVYVALLGLLEIEPVHAEQLNRRGINLSEALLLGYRSFPTDRNQRIKICKQLRQAGCELKGVPGFFRLPPREFSKGQWCMGGDRWGFRDIKTEESGVFKVTGLLIPTRDLEGRIRRLKVRNDAPGDEVPEAVKERFPERYMAFSSTAREDGAGSGAWVHVARPIYPRQNSSETETLWITEGEIKADIAALFLGETVLGMPGVGQSPGLAINTALAGGFREICVAMDSEDKPHVKLAIASLIKLAKENSLGISVACWDENKGKGLDDLLAAGGAPEVFEPDTWWNRLSIEHKKYVTDRINGRGAVR